MGPIWVFDIETFKHDWVVVFLNAKTEEVLSVHNDNSKIRDFLRTDPILIGFNNKHFDNYLLQAMVNHASPETIKDISDFIISSKRLPWEHSFIKEMDYVKLYTADTKDEIRKGISLKTIEGHWGRPIVESSIPFDIDRKLTDREIGEVIYYCTEDTKMTLTLLRSRNQYFNTKLRLAKLGGIDPVQALGMTNAKLTAAYLGAEPRTWTDGREYDFPPELDQSVIPQELLDFFKLIDNPHLSDKDLYETSITVDILGVPCKFAWGGVHGTLECYHQAASEELLIGHRDVSSLYPSLMVHYNYISRNLTSPERFKHTYHRRMEAKAENHIDGVTLKLPLNTASGAMENKYNNMYDPKQPRAVRITGQLLMAELVIKIGHVCPSFKLLNLNTDGFMYEISKSEKQTLDKVCSIWQNEKYLELEEKSIKKIWIKDVNNLLYVTTDDKITTVGGYLNYGISESSGWSISNNATVVADALINYFAKDIPVEETILNQNEPFKFQLIANASSIYSHVYQQNTNGRVAAQKVNRVYASKDRTKGTLFKVKHGKTKGEKIGNLPAHCLIDNEMTATIDQIDKHWYINLAKKRIEDYTGGNQWQLSFLKK